MAVSLSDISKYLTKEIIDKTYEFKTEDKAKFTVVTRAAPAGEGLLGAVYRVSVKGENTSASFIIKGLVSDALLRKSLNCSKYFKREALFYTKILPALLELEREVGAKQSIQNQVPSCYGCLVDGVHDFIILEDLAESKYISITENPTRRQRDLSLDVLAHLHAISMALRIKKPKEFSRIVNSIPEIYYNEENRDWYTRYLERAIEIDKSVVKELENPKSIYYEKFLEIVNRDIYSQFIEIVSIPGEHSVLNHGDAWCPNFLCSEDRSVAIDYQIVRCASPATDLAYFIILCGNHCKDKQDFYEAVDIYYKSFESYFKDLGFDVNKHFTKDHLMNELKRFGKFGLLATLTSIPLLASKRCDVLESFKDKYYEKEKIPLEDLWKLTPMNKEEHKIRLINAIHVSVDVGLI